MTKHILLGVTGSISAYKSADIANELTKKGYAVDVLMSKSSQEFITPLTLQSLTKRRVHTDVMDEPDPSKINHIELTKPTDLFLVAPATANIIGKLATGVADDLIGTVALALPSDRAKLIAPAMNTNMYEHPMVQKNLQAIKEIGYKEIEPRESLLACGDFGSGALATVDTIIEEVVNTLEGKEA
ncbi:phosphopantothenoylcysteine decarboxylase [Tetragenococcus koreensis]|uniref:phosphopantothenoylcysteine decarboxylase n=1 Tax=Tetragenococcus koreensis TaxID=290335 RepID=UPI001F412866|nr:phosphopantothenoylcysteine decarboxylase [Tetragenococcus koreensis]MDN5831848.1 phosphopantothenoylcysteine decarboxylase [Tetragenococcus halophilus]MCF1616763.1 phosphopantothenoylcysteine decarboxylase [Tetragenococcus koreensis]MCF1621699.1 phosphopantothenoylcysteine decarboxylase [Tetragenococcus koreensis]MCF1677738.1 phosphopantothenoylcysteine decarboxylase [Tetragenococcus koreensis]MCF1680257.1 phosphopantothenoylcysteine decarboxylase [Tetragenococcus koreensis]